MGGLEGKVALITGSARGQGRSHAVRLAEEGADIIALDLCAQIDTVSYPLPTEDDLKETARLVEALGRRVVTSVVDTRDLDALSDAVNAGIGELGRLDIVVANAAIWCISTDEPRDRKRRMNVWRDTMDVNVTGTWNTLEATVPILVERGNGGSIILISSTAGLRGNANNDLSLTAYTTSKHALVGMMRVYANDLARHSIRVNSIHPTAVATEMIENDVMRAYAADNPGVFDLMSNALPIAAIEPADVSNGVVYLASESGRYVTGVTLPVDAGFNL